MGKVSFLVKKVINMDYKHLFRTAGIVHKRSGKSRIAILRDIVRCGAKYQSGYMDYELFYMEQLTPQEREKILTCGKNNEYVRMLNDKNYRYIFSDKTVFNEKFSAFLNRDWIFLKDNEEAFARFLQNKERVIVKPISLSCGQGIEIIDVREKDPKELYQSLIESGRPLVEGVLTQRAEISALYPDAVNTLRLVTVMSERGTVSVVGAYIRIGAGGNVVDNFNHGGIAVPINIKSGVIEHEARNKQNRYFSKHPDTGTQIVGFQIPDWQEVIRFVKELALVVPQLRYVGWDICMTPNGLAVVEGNEYPGNDLYQLPKENIGTSNLIDEALAR